MTLLHNPQEWLMYTHSQADDAGLSPDSVEWGRGPTQYPCLVASTWKSERVFLPCYIYLDAALHLAQEAGYRLVSNTPVPQEVPGHTSQDFAISVAANLLALYAELEGVSITNRERFQGLYTKYLAMVEQYHAAEKAAIITELSAGQKDLLAHLFPSSEDGGENVA